MSLEADAPDRVVEALRSGNDLDLDPHEIDRQIPPVDLGKADGVLLGRDQHLRTPLLSTVDGIQHLLLAEAVVVGKAAGQDLSLIHISEPTRPY